MEFLDELIEQYRRIENSLALLLMQTQTKIAEMERLNMDENKINETMNESQHKGVYVPLAAYEMQQERFFEERKDLMDRAESEKDKMRKHYKHLVMFITIPFAIFIVGIFVFCIWFFTNYDLATYEQDGDGLNNIANKTTQGNVTYGAAPSDYPVEELITGEGNLDQQEEYWNDVG